MARSTRSKTRRKGGASPLKRLIQLVALIALVGMIYAAWFWFEMRSWKPDEEIYPEQGAVIATGTQGVRFETLKATGADFVYLDLGFAGAAPDPAFRERLTEAGAAGLKVGVVQPFDPCQRADPQSALFTRMVARDPGLLPPALALSRLPNDCVPNVSEAAVRSEILTLVNQIELHTGQSVILKVDDAFEARFQMANSLDRDLWLVRDRMRPRYAPRPWLLWSVNSQLVTQAADESLEWVVVQR